MKLCIAASSGGHLSELIRLKDIWKNRDHFFVTTRSFSLDGMNEQSPCYFVSWANRNHPWRILKMTYQCFRIAMKEKPDVVISTGAAVGVLLGVFTKLRGGRIVWVEIMARVDGLSLSGRLILPIADILLVQWPELANESKNIRYVGSVI